MSETQNLGLSKQKDRNLGAGSPKSRIPPHCYYDDEPPTHRVRWTVYGGALVTRYVCERHASVARGQRGIQLERFSPIT